MVDGREGAGRMAAHPYGKAARRQMVSGGLLVALGATLPFVAPAFVVVGGTSIAIGSVLLYFGVFSRRQVEAVVLANAAHDLVSRGRIAEAEKLLAAVRLPSGNIRRAVESQRAVIALRRGDGAAAEAHANVAIAAPRHLLTRHVEDGQIASVRAIRAFARATQGKEAEALEDVRVVRASDATPDALARAAVAEAIVLARKGAREEQAECLRKAAPLVEYLGPRERALMRALRRMVEVRAGAIYREPARRAEPSGEEPLVGEWVSRIVPEAAAFVPEAERRPQIERLEVAAASGRAAPAGSAAIAGQAEVKAKSRRTRRVLALWALLVVLFLTIWQLLSPVEPSRPAHPAHSIAASPPPLLDGFTATVSLIVVLLMAVFFGRIALAMRRARVAQLALRGASRELALGDVAAAETDLRALAQRSDHSTMASAILVLAGLAERRCALEQALELCDAGLTRISRLPALRALHNDLLVPELVAERAFVLAALGREDQANAELATLTRDHPTFAFMTRSVFRVRLVQALRRGDIEQAVRLSRERTPELPLSRRDELMADAVLAVSGGRTPPGEVERIGRELADDAELAAWIDFMAPGISGRLAAQRHAGNSAAVSPSVDSLAPEEEGADVAPPLRSRA